MRLKTILQLTNQSIQELRRSLCKAIEDHMDEYHPHQTVPVEPHLINLHGYIGYDLCQVGDTYVKVQSTHNREKTPDRLDFRHLSFDNLVSIAGYLDEYTVNPDRYRPVPPPAMVDDTQTYQEGTIELLDETYEEDDPY